MDKVPVEGGPFGNAGYSGPEPIDVEIFAPKRGGDMYFAIEADLRKRSERQGGSPCRTFAALKLQSFNGTSRRPRQRVD